MREQRGGVLVEVMMSALLVALAATAVFKGIDGANATSGQSKARAIATTLAHQDQERLRSMDPLDLSSYSPTPVQKVVNRVPYTITSSAAYVSDRGESESCTRGSGRVITVRITSQVTWPDMRGSKPVRTSSLIAISNAYQRGSLAIKFQTAAAAPVEGVGVSVTSPTSLSGSSNSAGCVVWDGLSTGSYFGSFSKAGYVDPSGAPNPAPVNGWSVTTGSTGIYTQLYDLAGSANFQFVGRIGTTNYPGAKASGVTVSHANMPTPSNVRTSTFTSSSTASFAQLFPFQTPYSAWAGCAANRPSTGAASVTVPPGALATPNPVIVPMPVMQPRVRRGNQNLAGANVTVRPADASCGGTVQLLPTDAAGLSTSPAADRAFPYGSYIVCADDTQRRIEQTVNLTSTGSATAFDLTIPTSGTRSTCA